MYGFAREAEPTHSGRLKLAPHARVLLKRQRCNMYKLVKGDHRNGPHLTTRFCFCVLSFAFVEFESTDDAKEALENLNNTDIEGRSIRLEYSQQNNRGNDGGRGNSGRTFFESVMGASGTRSDDSMTFPIFREEFKIVKS